MSHKIAQNSLDFSGDRSVTVPHQVGKRHGQTGFQRGDCPILGFPRPHQIAKAAEACASEGSIAEGVSVSMDIEQLILRSRTFACAASL
jgi:hypothetical protein